MNWLLLAIMSALIYGGYNFFLKLSSGHIHQVLGAVILQFSALSVGGALLLILRSTGQQLEFTRLGIIFAVLGGMCVASAEIIALYIFSRGVPATVGVPVIVGGTVAATTLYGMIFLRESLTLWQWLGLALVVIGIVMLTSKDLPIVTTDNNTLELTAS